MPRLETIELSSRHPGRLTVYVNAEHQSSLLIVEGPHDVALAALIEFLRSQMTTRAGS